MNEAKAEAFPGDCPTNAYVLEGFGHVVYMVSTVAGGNAGTEEAIVSRLKNAEKELRSQSPLVSLDLATNELFTFHRLIDFQKDGKNIYGRLAMVLQNNGCINSFKSALRATDLLKEEHTRLRGVLFGAVLLALKPSLLNDSGLIPLGMRSFLRTSISVDAQSWPKAAESGRRDWQIEMVDLQLLPHGQLLVVSISCKPENFRAMSDTLQGTEETSADLGPGILCLAPTGQMARFTDGRVFSNSTEHLTYTRQGTAQSEQEPAYLCEARMQSWKEHLLIWLAQQGVPDSYLDEKIWVEVEIPMARTKELRKSTTFKGSSEQLVWKRMLWPAQLCFYTQPHLTRAPDSPGVPQEDPIAFVQDWLLRSDERAREMPRGASGDFEDAYGQNSQSVDNLDEDTGFGSTPHMHNAFFAGMPPSQIMYPTPPDAPYTQATPGMSSVDGIGMTPADTTRAGPTAAEQQNDIDMLDMDAAGVGTGTYDEDLFEDLPSDRFGTAGATDEPDWEFFEQHNADTGGDQSQIDRQDTKAQDTSNKAETVPEDIGTSATRTDSTEESMLPPQLHERASAQPTISSPSETPKEAPLTQTNSDAISKTQHEDAEDLLIVDVPNEASTSPQVDPQLQLSEPAPEAEIWKKPPLPSGRGWRRSLYDSTEDLAAAVNHDERYTADGTFWFDSVPEDSSKNGEKANSRSKKIIGDLGRDIPGHESSSEESAGSEISSFYEADDMDLDEEGSVYQRRKWTEYESNPTDSHVGPSAEELDAIHTDTRNLLKLLRPMNMDHTWIAGNSTDRMMSIADSAIRVDHSAVTAQILVDQLTQTSLPRQPELVLQTSPAGDGRFDALRTLDSPYGRLEPATFIGLAKANEINSQNDGTKRFHSIERHQLCLSRTEKGLSVSSPALSLWEHLNLQPKGGRKDMQGFCVHPASANLEAGCGIFLERIEETYIGCNLGDHSTGQIAGTCNNGLVAWSDEDDTMPNLEQCCERLGTALARLPPTSDNIVIYMIMVPGLDASPVPLIKAFRILFEAYLKACNKQCPVELGLQIIPLDFVASPDTLVVRSSQEYVVLAIEVYNRFPPTKAEDQRAFCGSAVVLAESPGRRIRFEMASQNGASSEAGARFLHVAYSHSHDQRWIVVAWTDERGFRALTMCYPLRSPGKGRSRPRSEVFRDIWEVSQDLMTKERRRWRLVVARDGCYEASEVNEWAIQLNSSTNTGKCSLVLVAVDLHPALVPQTPASQPKTTQGATPQQPVHNYGTPVSTPQASTTSPDQYLTATPTPSGSQPLNAPTPPEAAFDPNNEADLTVQDATEDSWSVVLPFGLNQSREVTTWRPAMLSGYLLKRQGIRDEDGLVKLGVNLIHAPTLAYPQDIDDSKRKAVAAAREELLNDILVQYRGLVTLARTRGCIDPVHEVVPWHIATAIKGARILSRWM